MGILSNDAQIRDKFGFKWNKGHGKMKHLDGGKVKTYWNV